MKPSDARRRLQIYQVPSTEAPIDLHLERNEGAVPPESLFEALRESGTDVIRSYPETESVRAILAELRGLSPEQVLVTAGGDEAIDRFFRASLQPGQEVVVPTPTFDMIAPYVNLAHGRVKSVPWFDGPFPTQRVLEAVGPDTAAIVVISPNNPTGAIVGTDDLLRLAAQAPHCRLLVDAAYVEFTDADLTPTALSLPQAVVIRSLSKAWGLAGLRVGYALGSASMIAELRAAGSPYSVAGPSLALAAARLRSGSHAMERFVQAVRRERDDLTERLRDLGADPLPSEANFVLAHFKDAAGRVWRGLAGLGIAVRAFPGRPGLEDCLRISCPGRADHFQQLCASLEAVMRPQALLFDMDGVLADVSGSYRQAILDTCAAFGVILHPADISAAKAAGSANNDWELTRRLLASRGIEVSLERVTHHFEVLYQGELHARETLIGSRDLLERLRQRMRLAVVTGRPRADAMRFLKRVGIDDLFEVVVCMEDAPLKPDPAPVRLALDALGVASAWMVGDTSDDIRAARAAGVVPVGIVPPGDGGAFEALSRAGAAWVLKSLEELEVWLP